MTTPTAAAEPATLEPMTPTPSPFPASVGSALPQARVVLTPVAPVLEGPVDALPPRERSAVSGSGPPLLLIAGAAALVVLGVAGSVLSARRRQ